MKKKIQNKLGTYLAVTAGIGCAASAANAAVVFYGNSSNNNIQADPIGVNFGSFSGYRGVDNTVSAGSELLGSGSGGSGSMLFSGGSDLAFGTVNRLGPYYSVGLSRFILGAVAGAQNYAQMSFDGNNSNAEAVAQFFFDGLGGGYLMAIATRNAIPNPQNLSTVGGTSLSISAGKAMIDGAGGVSDYSAAVPEPSSLVLFALGATGLAARRQRRKAA